MKKRRPTAAGGLGNARDGSRARQLFRDLGGTGMLVFQLIVGGNALVPLVHPVFIVGLMWEISKLALQGDGWTALAGPMHYFAAAGVGI